MSQRTVAILQARTGSSRLPGKVLLELSGASMLERCVRRAQRSKRIDELVVATTIEPADDAIEELCLRLCCPCYRGDQDDVLDRYYRAAQSHRADIVVRLTADNPMVDSEVVDLVIEGFRRFPDIDYACNRRPRTFPLGLDVEVFSFDVLARAWAEDGDPSWREHVTPYIVLNPDLFRLAVVKNDEDYSSCRWTVDTGEDFRLATEVYKHFGHDRFGWREVMQLLNSRPELAALNCEVEQRTVS